MNRKLRKRRKHEGGSAHRRRELKMLRTALVLGSLCAGAVGGLIWILYRLGQ